MSMTPEQSIELTAIEGGSDFLPSAGQRRVSGRWRSLARDAALAVGGSTFSQLLGLISGFLIVRLLPPVEFALFGLAMAFMTMLNSLADSGVSQAVLALGARTDLDQRSLGTLASSARRALVFNGSIVAIVLPGIWLWAALPHASLGKLAFLLALILVSFFATLGANVFRNLLLLKSRLGATQIVDGFAASSRLTGVLATIWMFPMGLIAFSCGLVGDVVRYVGLRRAVKSIADLEQAPDAGVVRDVYKFVRRVLPVAMYFALSSQILFVLMSVVASSTELAGAGALSRFHQLYFIVPAFTALFLAPRLALMNKVSPQRFAVLCGAGVLITLLVSLPLAIFPHFFLWILGPAYERLDDELRLLSISSGAASIAGVVAALGAARGWIIPPWAFIPCHFIAMFASILAYPLNTVAGYMRMHVVVQAVVVTVNVVFVVLMFRKQSRMSRVTPIGC